MDRVYHIRRSCLTLSLVGLTLFGGFGAVWTTVWLSARRPPDEVFWLAALGIALISMIFVFFCAMSCYLLVAYFCHTLSISENGVVSVGVFRTARVELDSVLEARWRLYGSFGRLRLRTVAEKLAVDFGDYPPDQARELIRFFRHRLPQGIQQGWDRYWRFYWRRFDEPDPARREHFAQETRRLRRRMLLWVSLGTGLCTVLGLIVWWWTGDTQSLRGIVLCLLFWPVVWLAKADRGKIGEKAVVQPSVNAAAIVGLILFGLTWVVSLACAALAIPAGRMILFVGLMGSLLLIFLGIASESRRIERSRADAARLAEIEYMGAPNGLRQR